MRKVNITLLAAGALLFSASSHATLIEDTWTMTIDSINFDNNEAFTGEIGDRFSFVTTYDASQGFLKLNGENYCARDTEQALCDTIDTSIIAASDYITNTFITAITPFFSGVDLTATFEQTFNDGILTVDLGNGNDYDYYLGNYTNASVFFIDDENDYNGTSAYGSITVNWLDDNNQSAFAIFASEQVTRTTRELATTVSEPGMLSVFALGVFGVASLRRRFLQSQSKGPNGYFPTAKE